MKKLFSILFGILFLASCATLQSDQKFNDLEKRVEQLEMSQGAGVGANFYPFRALVGDVAGTLDHLDGASLSDKDVAFVIMEGDPLNSRNSVFMYVLNATSNCGGTDLPWYVRPASNPGSDPNEKCWELVDVWGDTVNGGMIASAQTAASPNIEDYNTGTYYLNQDDDAIQFNLPVAAANLIYCFGNGSDGDPIDQIITIEPDGNDMIILDGDECGAGVNIASTADGNSGLCIIGIDANIWKVTGYTGTWACGS